MGGITGGFTGAGFKGGTGLQKIFDPGGLLTDNQVQFGEDDQAAFKDANLAANKAKVASEENRLKNSTVAANALAPQADFRNAQTGLASTLQNRVAGTGGPSVAELQMQKAQQNNLAAQMAAASSARGANSGLTARNLASNIANSGQQLVADTGLLRAQEQQAAENSLATLIGQGRGQDISAAQLTADDAIKRENLVQQYVNMGLNLDAAQFQANQDMVKTKMGIASQNSAINREEQAAKMKMISSAAAMMSDKNQKTNIEDSSKDVSDFLSSLSSKSYEYKDPSLEGTREGRRFGILAQDLEKSKMGKSLVMDTPKGKMVDVAQSVGALLSATSELNRRLKKVEGK